MGKRIEWKNHIAIGRDNATIQMPLSACLLRIRRHAAHAPTKAIAKRGTPASFTSATRFSHAAVGISWMLGSGSIAYRTIRRLKRYQGQQIAATTGTGNQKDRRLMISKRPLKSTTTGGRQTKAA